MILADIGNRYVHICRYETIEHLSLFEAIDKYGADEVYYINVNSRDEDTLVALDGWIDISDRFHIEGEYKGMGIDRKALCLSRRDGIFVDAGSAITVDKVVGGVYEGGFIMPGIHAYQKAFSDISEVLDHKTDKELSIDSLPKSTRDSVSYGAIAPIVAIIEKIKGDTPLYFVGGDGEWLSKYFTEAHYDDMLLFDGMKKVLKGL